MPPDLAAALASDPQAQQAFERLSKTQQYAVILDVVTARTETTRAARIRKAVAGMGITESR